MQRLPPSSFASSLLIAFAWPTLLLAGCPGTEEAEDSGVSLLTEADSGTTDRDPMLDAGGADPVRVNLTNEGGAMEGHTPRGFQGQGIGLFAGDNLNPNFPDGDGVQIFLSFDVSAVPAGEIVAARLFSDHGSTSGSPYQDLGQLEAEEIEYSSFSSALYNLEPTDGGHTCVFGTSAAGPHACDIAPVIARAIAESRQYAQVRLRFEQAGDADESQDLATFFISGSNINEPGIFGVEVDVLED